MTLDPAALRPFPTVLGRGLLAEIAAVAAPPVVVVTMPDLLPLFRDRLPDGAHVHLVGSLERADLESQVAALPPAASVVGLGGGQALDVAKYLAWRRHLPLHQLPTSLSVDAMFGQRAGVREDGLVRYLGWAVPQSVYLDLDVIAAAPPRLNRAGLGDALCLLTGAWDWRHAHERGRCEPRWPFDARLAAHSESVAEDVLAGAQAIHDVSPEGIALLVRAFQWGGASYHASGWCPRHVEGIEHQLFYALEARTRRKFVHGEPVCLGIVLGALLFDRRAEELRQAIATAGVDIRPRAMGLAWDDVGAAVLALPAFARDAGLPWGIAQDAPITPATVRALRDLVESAP